MPSCKTCKFFKPDGGYNALGNTGYGSCDHPKIRYEDGVYKGQETDLLLYGDYEGYAAGISVGPDFGCIHHVEK